MAAKTEARLRLPLPASKVHEFRIQAAFNGRAKNTFGVGCGVFVTSKAHPGCVLLGKRKGSTGEGLWALPGGHLEFAEALKQCATRELAEETGISKTWNERVVFWDNAVDAEAGYHYVIAFVRVETSEEPKNMEPDKCEGWHWCKWDGSSGGGELEFPRPEELFLGLRNVRDRGLTPFVFG